MKLLIAILLTLSLNIQARTIKLTDQNSYSLNGPVTSASVNNLIVELYKRHKALPKGEPLYLPINSPGGSVFDGLRLINFLRSLDREIKTIPIFAASMGFQIVQALGERLSVQGTMLMAHPASVRCQGNYIELQKCSDLLRDVDEILLKETAERLDIDPEVYKRRIEWEWWITGPALLKHKAVDEQVEVVCSPELLEKVNTITERTMFGDIKIEKPACPLLEVPLGTK